MSSESASLFMSVFSLLIQSDHAQIGARTRIALKMERKEDSEKKKQNSIIFCPQAATVKTDAGMQCSRISIKKGYMFQWHNLLSRMSLPEAKVILTAEGSPHSICKLPPVS